MKHVIFDVAAGGAAAAEAFRLAVDVALGYPRGPEVWNQHFSEVVINVAGQDDPNSPYLKAAVDVSNGYSPAGQDYENEALWVLPLSLVAAPEGAVVDDEFDMNDPLWTKPFGGP